MGTSSTLVIKVKYGDMLRRFGSQIVDEKLNLTILGLRKKILSLFSFAPDTDLILTYIDEDGDVVSLVDDDDINDVVKQALNPLRITAKVSAEKSGEQCTHSTENSTPLRSPVVQPPTVNTSLSELLRTIMEPSREMLLKLSADLKSKASYSPPGITELVEYFSKVGLTYLSQLSESQPRLQSSTQSVVPGSPAATETKDLELSEVDPASTLKTLPNVRSELSSKNNVSLGNLKPEAAMENNEVKIPSVTGGSMENSCSGVDAVAAPLGSQNINVAQSKDFSLINSAPLHPKSGVVSHRVGKKEKFKRILESHLNGKSQLTSHLPDIRINVGRVDESGIMSSDMPSAANSIATGENVNSPNDPTLGSNSANVGASDPKTRECPEVGGTSVLPDGFGKFPGSIQAPSPMNECPFSGIGVGNVLAAPPHSATEAVPFRSMSQNDGSLFHCGVRCDGCGIHPIIGPRFKSKVKVDYDLCSTCFEDMGNDSDYIRMDFPVVYRSRVCFKSSPDAVCRGSKIKSVTANLDSRFVQDVNIIDGTVMEPLTPFTKTWRMRNNGTRGWPQGTQFVWIGGDELGNALSVELKIPAGGLWMNQELDVTVDFITPELPGWYISYWRMATPSGQKFGQRVWVLIQVDASVKEAPRESIRNLNLNLPPVSSCLTGPEIINVTSEPIIEGNQSEPDNSKKMVELVQPNTGQELKFPVNDSLLVGHGASSSIPFSASPSVPYPIIDLCDVSPFLPAVPPMLYPQLPPMPSVSPIESAPESAVDHHLDKKQVEEKLLRQLEEMGFKHVDQNKEALRMNEYVLEQAMDDLCGVSERDPMLKEHQETGCHDREMYKMLLKKNNGSIKRAVMDLIAGEMA